MGNLDTLKKSQAFGARGLVAAFLLLLVAALAGSGIAWLAVSYGQVDVRVHGPLFPPLAISLSFVIFALGLAFLNVARIRAWFDGLIPPNEKALRTVIFVIGVVSAYETVRVFLFMFIDYWPTDLPSYHFAGMALKKGMDPYSVSNLTELASGRVFPYLYPPLLAILWMPFVGVPFEIVSTFWQILSLVALVASLFLCLRLAQPSNLAARAAALICALVLPLGNPSGITAHHGSISIIFAFLIILFFERLSRNKDHQAGIILAFLCGLKALPILLVIYLLLKRRFRALLTTLFLGAILLGVSVSIVGWEIHWQFVVDVAPEIGYAVHSDLGFDASYHPENQSINGFMNRVICNGWSSCSFIIIILCLMVAFPMAWLVARRREVDGIEAAALATVLLLVSPITWFHHLVLLHLPAIVLVSLFAGGIWRPRWWPVVVLVFAVIMAHDFGRPIMPIRFFTPLSHARFFMLIALYIVSLLSFRGIKKGVSQKTK